MTMSNDDRTILQLLIMLFYNYFSMYPYGSSLPLDTNEWRETFTAMGVDDISDTELKSKYNDVIRVATQNFERFNFEIVEDDQKCRGPWRIWLKYERKPELQK